MLERNIGPLDRTVRSILGGAFIFYRFLGHFHGVWWDLATIFGATAIWEGLLGYCFLYGVFGVGTRRKG